VWLIDVLGWKRWTTPLVVFGVNPLVAFVGSGMMARLIYSVIRVPYGGESVPIQRVTYETLFASWLAPRNASLLFAVTFVLIWAAILWTLHRRRVYLRV
jgi:predicted acyltransferase